MKNVLHPLPAGRIIASHVQILGGSMSDAHPRPRAPGSDGIDLERGLPMFSPGDPEALAQEKAELAELARRPLAARWWGYARRSGPGWLQSAMTLGGGTAAASLTLGALFGYRLLWVQPLAM
ncbi:MAG: hypothetical protein IMZ66_03570, partial [Planctomycetes bacterium]|nr:hypothetical protein [Planctomycetota bacterium]